MRGTVAPRKRVVELARMIPTNRAATLFTWSYGLEVFALYAMLCLANLRPYLQESSNTHLTKRSIKYTLSLERSFKRWGI